MSEEVQNTEKIHRRAKVGSENVLDRSRAVLGDLEVLKRADWKIREVMEALSRLPTKHESYPKPSGEVAAAVGSVASHFQPTLREFYNMETKDSKRMSQEIKISELFADSSKDVDAIDWPKNAGGGSAQARSVPTRNTSAYTHISTFLQERC